MKQSLAHWSVLTRMLVGLLFLILPLGVAACGGGDDDPFDPGVSLQTITVSPAAATVAVGATQQFAVNGVYTDGTRKTVTTGVTWTSSSTTVATVSATGLASAVADGSTTITATVGSLKATSTLTVVTKTLTGIQLTPASASIGIGTTQQYLATANFSDGTTSDVTTSATWSSSNTSTATIGSTGLASGVAAGITTITAQFESVSGTATLTVTDKAMTAIVVAPVTATVQVGATQAFIATAQFDDGTTQAITSEVTWSSSDEDVATISVTGTATGVTAGTSTITASHAASGLSGTATLTVSGVTITALLVTPATADAIAGGANVEFTATATYSDGTSADVTDSATWSSSDADVATVTAGTANPLAAGTATISAEFDGEEDSATLTVEAAVLDTIVVTPATATLQVGATQQFTAVGNYNNGTTADLTNTASWQSSDADIATVSAAGLATGVAAGQVSITATMAGVTGTAALTVEAVVLTAIQVTPATAAIAINGTQAYTATGTYSNNSTANLTNLVSWNSSNTAVATIDATGVATGVTAGASTISATYMSVDSNNVALVVSPAVVTDVAVTCVATTIANGTDTQCTAQANYDDGTSANVTSAATWTTSDADVATVTQLGLASGEGEGSATITATYSGISGTVDITVTSAVLTGIQVTPGAPSIALGTDLQFAATGTYSDGSSQPITTAVSWSSSHTTVATITLGGLATGDGVGQSTITAALSGITGTATLTVTPATITSLTISPLSATVAMGVSRQFTATANFSDGTQQNVTSSASWATSDSSIPTLVGGLAEGVDVGTATITATYSGQSASATFEVTVATVTRVEVDPVAATIANGTTQQFTAVAILSDGTNTGTLTTGVTWTSSATAVATINAAGLATAVSTGTTNIRATYLGVQSDPSVLTVSGAVPTGITITPASATIANGTSRQFTAWATMSDGSPQQNVTSLVAWSSSNNTVATVVAGLAESVAPGGPITITATYTGLPPAEASLTVTSADLTHIAITTTDDNIPLGSQTTFTAIGTYTDGSEQPISNLVNWNQNPVGVLSFGTGTEASVPATGASVGTTSVTASLAGVTSNALSVEVVAVNLLSISISPSATQNRYVGETIQFTAIGHYDDGNERDLTTDPILTWNSSASTIVSISNTTNKGTATALVEGTANITANVGTIFSDPTTVNVLEMPTIVSISLSPTSAIVNVGGNQVFAATAHLADGTTQPLTTGTWTVENEAGGIVSNVSLATVSGNEREATGVSSTVSLPGGVAYVAVASGVIKTRSTIEVKDTNVTGITVTCPETTCLPTGYGYVMQCTAEATYSDGTSADVTSTATWSIVTVPATDVATVGDGPTTKGRVTIGTAPGTAVVTATFDGESGTETLASATQTVTALAVTPPSFSLYVPQTQQLAAVATFSGTGACAGTRTFNVSRNASWSSSAISVATVNNNHLHVDRGLVTAVGAGPAAITGSFGGLAAIANVTVSAACVQSVQIGTIGNNNQVPTNITAPLTVTATYSDGNAVNLSPTAGTWNSTAVDDNWRLTVGAADISNLTFTLNTALACSPPVTDSIDVTVDADAVLTELKVVRIDGSETFDSMPTGSSRNVRALATFTGFGEFNVSPFASWANTPAITGLTHAAVATAQGPARRFSHTGDVEGVTNIFATYKTGVSDPAFELTISGKTAQSIEILPGSFSPAPDNGYPGGLIIDTVARVTFSDGTTELNPSGVSWSSSHDARLTFANATTPVAQTFTGTANQSVTLTVSFTQVSTVTNTATVNVNTATISEMAFSPVSGQSRPLNSTTPLTVIGQYSNGSQFDISNQLDSIVNNNGTIAEVLWDATNGLRVATYNSTGLATSTLTKSGLSRGYSVNVTGTCISSIAFTLPAADPVNIGEGEDVSFRATATNTGGGTSNVTGAGQWSPSNAYLTNAGTSGSGAELARVYRGASEGDTSVTFTYTSSSICKDGVIGDNTIEISRDVTVNSNVMAGIEIRPQPVAGQTRRRLPAGQHLQLALYALYTNGTYGTENLASSATWSIDNVGAADPSVSSEGLLNAGTLLGVDAVKADYSGFEATLPIEVFNCGAPTVAISSTASGRLPIGEDRNYSAVASYASSTSCPLDAAERSDLNVTAFADWASSSTAVAAFLDASVRNRVTGIAAGTTDITATYNGGTSNSIALQVVSVTLHSLTISASGTSTYVGGFLDVTVSAIWRDSANNSYNLDPPSNLTWLYGIPGSITITADPAVPADPKVYFLKGEEIATDSSYRARWTDGTDTVTSNTLSVDVVDDCVAEVRIANPDPTQPANTSGMVDFECRLNDQATFEDCNATYVASNTALFVGGAIGADGSYTVAPSATAGAHSTITATYQGTAACPGATLSDESTVTVGAATLDNVAISSGPNSIALNTYGDYEATATFNCPTCTSSTYSVTDLATWTSSNTMIASFGATPGRLNAGNVAGTTYITAMYGGMTTNLFLVEVSGKVATSLAISASPNRVTAVPTGADAEYPRGGRDLQLHATVTWSDNSTDVVTSSATWSRESGTAGTISTGGLFTTANPGSTSLVTVKAVFDDVEDTFIVRVRYSTGGFTAVNIFDADGTAPTNQIAEGLSHDYLAQATYGGVAYWFTRNANWSSSTTTVGTITQSGGNPAVFNAITPGATQIIAAVGTVIGSLDVTVTDAVALYLYCEPDAVTLNPGDKAQLFARVYLSDDTSNDVTTSGDTSWASTDVAVAEFNSNDPKGVITAKATGWTYAVPSYQGLPIDDADRCLITIP